MRCAVIVGLLLVGGVASAEGPVTIVSEPKITNGPPVTIVTQSKITYTPRPHSETQLVFPTQPANDDATEVCVFLGLGVLAGLVFLPRSAR